jgi:hypothetical protein
MVKKMSPRKLVAVAFLALASASSQAAAQADTTSASQTFTINGTAAAVCLLGTPNSSGSNNATYAANTITLTQFIDPSTALVNAASMTLNISNAMCNYSAWLSIGSQNGGLKPSSAATVVSGSGGFLTLVPYTVTANWGAVQVMLDTSSGNNTARVQAGGANSGSLSLVFATQKSSLPVVQGNYSDTVTVKIGASL